MLLKWCQLLAGTSLSVALRDSKWGFAVVEMFHLISLALFGGSVLFGVLRASGAVLPAPARLIAGELRPLFLTGFLGLLASGALLFVESPLRYYANPAFRIKLGLIVLSGFLTFLVVTMSRSLSGSTRRGACTGFIFLTAAAWLATAVAGRIVGVL
jgi:hypothetical protein